MTDASPPAAPDDMRARAVRAALARALRPLVRLMIAVGIPFPAAADLLKRLYVDTAARDFPLDGKPVTQSRVTLLTGVHRKDVRRLLESDRDPPDKRTAVPLGALIVGRWLGDPRYRTEDGQPRPLPRIAPAGPDAAVGFDTLVASVSTDLRPRVVLDEWRRQGLVTLDAADRVVLDATAFTPSRHFGERAAFLGWNLGDHAGAAVHNLLADGPPLFERAVFYDGLTPASLDRVETLARREADALLIRVNQEARRLVEADAGRPEATGRMRLGAYFFRDAGDRPPAVPAPELSDDRDQEPPS